MDSNENGIKTELWRKNIMHKMEKRREHSNGTLKRTQEFKNGKLNGYYKTFYDNGNIASVHHYTNDRADKHFTTYKEDGSVRFTERSYYQ